MSTLRPDHSTGPASDDSATALTRAGEETHLFIAHANRLRRTVRRIVNTSDANLDDACAFAWTQLVAKRPRRETVFPWLVKVATREAIRLDKRERRWADADDQVIGDVAADASTEHRALLFDIVNGLERIHPRRRHMLLLHAAGFTCDEIAADHGINPSRGRALVYKARLQLRSVARDVDGVDADAPGGWVSPRSAVSGA
jgi:DNA-directed RNA polymerase specialized sigma24 family protein